MLNVKRGEIYFVDFGDGHGSEIAKVRPCVVVQNNIGNTYAPTTIVLPISHRRKNINQPSQVVLEKKMFNGKGKVDGVIMGEQVRTINKTRIKSYTGENLLPDAMKQVDNAIKVALGLSV